MGFGQARTWGLGLALLAGCAGPRTGMHQSLLTDRNPAAHTRDLELRYEVRYPDVLAVEVTGRPALSGSRPVSLDGLIQVGPVRLPVDGRSPSQVAREAASLLQLPPDSVRVRVEKYASQHVYLFGEVDARHHVVAYHGPETILGLLQRVGGASPDAALSDVHVLRPHVADGKPPEVFHIDLHAILTRQDLSTNIRLEPSDRIHIGPTRTKQVSDFMPPWFQVFCKGKSPPG